MVLHTLQLTHSLNPFLQNISAYGAYIEEADPSACQRPDTGRDGGGRRRRRRRGMFSNREDLVIKLTHEARRYRPLLCAYARSQ